MADKEKQLRKILVKINMKGRLKLVATLEEAHLILVQDKRCASRTKLIGKDTYLEMVVKVTLFPKRRFIIRSLPTQEIGSI